MNEGRARWDWPKFSPSVSTPSYETLSVKYLVRKWHEPRWWVSVLSNCGPTAEASFCSDCLFLVRGRLSYAFSLNLSCANLSGSVERGGRKIVNPFFREGEWPKAIYCQVISLSNPFLFGAISNPVSPALYRKWKVPFRKALETLIILYHPYNFILLSTTIPNTLKALFCTISSIPPSKMIIKW